MRRAPRSLPILLTLLLACTGHAVPEPPEEARNHTSFLKDEVPLPGRDLSLSVRFRF